MQNTPSEQKMSAAIKRASAQVSAARQIRERHRGKKRPSRPPDIDQSLKDLAAAAAPLRSYIGMVAAHEIDFEVEAAMKRAIEAVAVERRKLRKMRHQ